MEFIGSSVTHFSSESRKALKVCSVRSHILSSPNLFFLQIKELPCELTSINSLVIFLTRFLWHISAHHAAINYPLTDYGAFTLNMPTQLYRDSRVSDDDFSLFRFPNANISAVSVLNSIRILVPVRHRLQTADYRLQTADCRPAVKCILGQPADCRLIN